VNFDKASRTRFRLRYASPEDLAALARIENNVYEAAGTLGERGIREWYRANPEIFRVVEFDSNQSNAWVVCGYHLIAPLLKPHYDRVISGAVQDFDVPATALADFSEKFVESVYVMDVLLDPTTCPEPRLRHSAAAYLTRDMIWRLVDLVKTFPHLREVAAITASEIGSGFVSKFGFKQSERYANSLGWKLWIASGDNIRYPGTRRAQRLVRTRTRFRSEYVA
jgi:hypothetical protein